MGMDRTRENMSIRFKLGPGVSSTSYQDLVCQFQLAQWDC